MSPPKNNIHQFGKVDSNRHISKHWPAGESEIISEEEGVTWRQSIFFRDRISCPNERRPFSVNGQSGPSGIFPSVGANFGEFGRGFRVPGIFFK